MLCDDKVPLILLSILIDFNNFNNKEFNIKWFLNIFYVKIMLEAKTNLHSIFRLFDRLIQTVVVCWFNGLCCCRSEINTVVSFIIKRDNDASYAIRAINSYRLFIPLNSSTHKYLSILNWRFSRICRV